MKKILFLFALGMSVCLGGAYAQSKKESAGSARERHKKFWKKVGKDQRDFWKGEHERHVKAKEARDAHVKKKPRKHPPKPYNPFKKKKKS